MRRNRGEEWWREEKKRRFADPQLVAGAEQVQDKLDQKELPADTYDWLERRDLRTLPSPKWSKL